MTAMQARHIVMEASAAHMNNSVSCCGDQQDRIVMTTAIALTHRVTAMGTVATTGPMTPTTVAMLREY